MDAEVFIILINELWENSKIVGAILTALTFIGSLLGFFIAWRVDRTRLTRLENDRDKMREDFEQHKTDNIESFKEIRESIHQSNQSVVDKMDELKMFLLHSKITLKGQDNEKIND